MAILVLLPNALQPYAAFNDRVPLEAATVDEAVGKLIERYPDIQPHLPRDLDNPPHGAALYRNGLDLRYLKGRTTELRPNDRLTIVVPEGDM